MHLLTFARPFEKCDVRWAKFYFCYGFLNYNYRGFHKKAKLVLYGKIIAIEKKLSSVARKCEVKKCQGVNTQKDKKPLAGFVIFVKERE